MGILGMALGLLLPMRALSQSNPLPYVLQTNLVVSGLTNANSFGYSVAVQGNTLVAGFIHADNDDGEAYVFHWNGSAWVQTQRLTPNQPGHGGWLGSSVALDGNWMAVGAMLDIATNSSGGAVYYAGTVQVYHYDGSQWNYAQTLMSTNPGNGDFLGNYVAVSRDTIVAGVYENDLAEVFHWDGNHWVNQAHLVPPGPSNGGGFGQAVAINESADTIAIGASGDSWTSPTATNYGSVYIYDRVGTNWVVEPRLGANDPAANQDFGRAVSISGNTLVAATYGNSMQVFERDSGTWQFQTNFPGAYNSGTVDRIDIRGHLIAQLYNDSSISVYEQAGNEWRLRDQITNNFLNIALDGAWVVATTGISNGIAVYTPYSNPTGLADYAKNLLYYSNAMASGTFDPDQTAFRYKTLLYAADTNGVRAQFDLITDLYGPAEQNLANFAEGEVAKGLAFHPDDTGLGNLLLDIYYDRSTAESILAGNLLQQAVAAHFPTAISGQPAPGSGFVIDNEIPLYQQALATNRDALQSYFSLFTNDLNAAGSPPLGYQIFTNLVPARSLMPATYLGAGGMPQSVVSNNAALFNGYKDLTFLFNELKGYGETAVLLGRLLLARNGPGDGVEASNLLSSAQRLLFLNGAFLKGLFATLPGTNDPSGLAQSIDGWSSSLTALNTLQQNLSGGANVLGFAPDFLMYVYSLPGQSSTIFNSYDALYAYLNPGNPNNSSHPLSLATSALQAAESSYAAYRGYQDQYADQTTSLNQGYTDRLRTIVGAYPGDPSYSDNPTNNPGSELDQQFQIIQQARLKILENTTEMYNLRQRAEIEINRASSVSNAIINYGNKAASIEETIGHIQAAQAAAQSAADGVNTVAQAPAAVGIVAAANTVNGAVQAGAEIRKGQLEAEKEQDAALQQATLTGIDSAAAVKTMLLDMNTLLIESQEAALQLQQALNQLTGLYREKEQLEHKLAQQTAASASRYYADPIHRVLAQTDMVDADQQFDNAQRWLFFMERALEYKWNTPLDHAFNGITWTEDTLFRLRNADELNNMFNAMNDWDASLQATLAATQTNVDYFSVRDDFFGYAPSNSLGQALTYSDPITGQLVDAKQAFRDRLRQLLNADDPNNTYIDLPFSTVRQIPGKAFFQGPVFSSTGTLISRGLCLDKIQWIKISLPGPHTFGGTYLQGTLTYGGTSFIRNLVVGAYDPLRPDRLMNEMTAYSTRRWYFSPSQDVFTSEEAQSTSASMQLTTQSGVVPTATEIDVFNERSVATSGWDLRIPITVSGTPVLSIDQLDDIEIWFKHIATDRITQ